jgi:hypothetical protein
VRGEEREERYNNRILLERSLHGRQGLILRHCLSVAGIYCRWPHKASDIKKAMESLISLSVSLQEERWETNLRILRGEIELPKEMEAYQSEWLWSLDWFITGEGWAPPSRGIYSIEQIEKSLSSILQKRMDRIALSDG